jgi:toxin ParE1/3/4
VTRGRRYKVELAEDAERDIEDIYRYIAAQESTARADAVLRELEAAYERLAGLPDRGNVPKEMTGVGLSEFREVHIGPYRMIYRVAGRNVIVDCVFDGRRDVQSLLQRRLLR